MSLESSVSIKLLKEKIDNQRITTKSHSNTYFEQRRTSFNIARSFGYTADECDRYANEQSKYYYDQYQKESRILEKLEQELEELINPEIKRKRLEEEREKIEAERFERELIAEEKREAERFAEMQRQEQMRIDNNNKKKEQRWFSYINSIALSDSDYDLAERLKPIRKRVKQFKCGFTACGEYKARLTVDGRVVASGVPKEKGVGPWTSNGLPKHGFKLADSWINDAVKSWRNIVAIEAYKHGILGLKADGSVLFVLDDSYNQKSNIGLVRYSTYKLQYKRFLHWKEVTQISAITDLNSGGSFSMNAVFLGLQSNGSVIGADRITQKMHDIVAISTGDGSYYDKYDGHVVTLNKYGGLSSEFVNIENDYCNNLKKSPNNCCNVGKWKDIVDISAGMAFTAGLKSDGRVVAFGKNDDGQCETQNWKNIVAIACGSDHTIGLRANGTVVATGEYNETVKGWNNIVAIYSGPYGLTADGVLVANEIKDYEKNIANMPLVSINQLREKFRLCPRCGSKQTLMGKCMSLICEEEPYCENYVDDYQ